MQDRLQEICTLEQCPATVVSHLDEIIQYSEGDMRRAVTTLQSVHSIVTGATATSTNSKRLATSGATDIISSATIAEIVGVPPHHVVNELWDACIQSSYDVMHAGVENVIASGFSAQLLLSALLTQILLVPENENDSDKHSNTNLDELSLSLIAIRIAETEKNMIDGADEYLQLMTVCSLIFACYNKAQ
jgi:replication factor C subunit 2/4